MKQNVRCQEGLSLHNISQKDLNYQRTILKSKRNEGSEIETLIRKVLSGWV